VLNHVVPPAKLFAKLAVVGVADFEQQAVPLGFEKLSQELTLLGIETVRKDELWSRHRIDPPWEPSRQ
jgi:hypothetical protein